MKQTLILFKTGFMVILFLTGCMFRQNNPSLITEHESFYKNIKTNCYYVSVKGSNKNNGLSELTPLRTLSKAVSLINIEAGGLIILLPGEYKTNNDNLLELYNKDFKNPLIIRGEGTVIFDGQSKSENAFDIEGASNIIIKNIIIRNYKLAGIFSHYTDSIEFSNITIYKCGFSGTANMDYEGYGLDVKYSKNIRIKDNIVYQCGPSKKNIEKYGKMGTGINTYELFNSLIENNYTYNNCGGGILIEDGQNIIVRNNRSEGHILKALKIPSDSSSGEWWCAGIWVDGGENIIIDNNILQKNITGLFLSNGDKQPTVKDYNVLNNSFYKNKYAIQIEDFGKNPVEDIIKITGNKYSENEIDIFINE